MKRILISAIILFALSAGTDAKGQIQVSFGLNYFYTSLSPYGEWIESDFGYAWRPMRVKYGWRPYLHGRWAWTSYGWYWVSSEPFGWATFHYGRWYYDDYYGWIWIPDYDWGPGWVEWCYNDNYIGWAPLSPHAHFGIHIGITFVNNWVTPVHYWNFIPGRHFTSSKIVNYVQPVEGNRRIIGNTRSGGGIRGEDNRIVNTGIDVGRVERFTNTKIRRAEVVERNRGQQDQLVRDGGRDRIEAFRPRIEKDARDAQLKPPNVSRDKRERTPAMMPRDQVRERQGKPGVSGPDRQTERKTQGRVPQRENDRGINRTETEQRQEIQRREAQQRQEKQREVFDRQKTKQREGVETRNRQIPRYERVEPPAKEKRSTQQVRPQKPPRQSEPRSTQQARPSKPPKQTAPRTGRRPG